MNLATDVFEQAKDFFARPLEEKMEVCTDLMPEEFCGYHPSERYNWEASKRKGMKYLNFFWVGVVLIVHRFA